MRGLSISAALFLAATVLAQDAPTVRLTSDGRSVLGAFSPDGSKVAILRVEKRYDDKREAYFVPHLDLWDGKTVRSLASPGAGRVFFGGGEAYGYYEFVVGGEHAPQWLPSGQFLFLRYWRDDHARGVLARVSDGATAAVDRYGGWFVFNASWKLSAPDEAAMNRILHQYDSDPNPSYLPKWQRAGTRLPPPRDGRLRPSLGEATKPEFDSLDTGPKQLVSVSPGGGKPRRLTSGDMLHTVCDVHGDRLLVTRRPVGSSMYQGDLLIVSLP